MAKSLEERIAALTLDYVLHPPSGRDPVVDLASPDELQAVFAEVTALGFDNDATPCDDDSLVAAAELVIKHSVHTSHPRFINQNFAGSDPVAVVGDWLGAALNTTGATYEVAPVFTLMESAVLSKLGRIAGYLDDEGDAEGDAEGDRVPTLPPGLFCPGGSSATLQHCNSLVIACVRISGSTDARAKSSRCSFHRRRTTQQQSRPHCSALAPAR